MSQGSSAAKDIGYDRALALTLERAPRLAPKSVPVWEATGLALAEGVRACVDSPSLSASMRDGFALRAADVEGASESDPRELALCGVVNAGQSEGLAVERACAVKVMTGAPIPTGADAVVSAELASEREGAVAIRAATSPGRNVLPRGADVRAGDLLAEAGEVVSPAMTGLLAAGGLETVSVRPRPRVAVLATGDEVVAPGGHLGPGQLYASNLVTLRSWLQSFGMESEQAIVPDEPEAIRAAVESLLPRADALLTSGGAWKSVRDFTPRVLEEMGAEVVYQRVRLAPGKAVAFALFDGAVAFCLPGGPPSNEMAFLQLALPGLLHMAGLDPEPFEWTRGRLTAEVAGGKGDPTWTSFHQAKLIRGAEGLQVEPLRAASRLQSQARAEALVKIPEGPTRLAAGEEAEVQLLRR